MGLSSMMSLYREIERKFKLSEPEEDKRSRDEAGLNEFICQMELADEEKRRICEK